MLKETRPAVTTFTPIYLSEVTIRSIISFNYTYTGCPLYLHIFRYLTIKIPTYIKLLPVPKFYVRNCRIMLFYELPSSYVNSNCPKSKDLSWYRYHSFSFFKTEKIICCAIVVSYYWVCSVTHTLQKHTCRFYSRWILQNILTVCYRRCFFNVSTADQRLLNMHLFIQYFMLLDSNYKRPHFW